MSTWVDKTVSGDGTPAGAVSVWIGGGAGVVGVEGGVGGLVLAVQRT